MGTLQIGAENAPGDGVVVTTANGGGFDGGGGVCYFYSPAAYNGTYGYHFISNGAAVFSAKITAQMQAPAAANSMRLRFYFRFGTLPTGNLQKLFWIGNYQYGVSLFGLRVQSNGTLVLEDGAGGTPFVSGFAVAVNTWYRLEFNFAPSNTLTGANSRVLLAVGPAANTFTTTNSATQAYFYSTTFQASSTNSAVVPGIGPLNFGINATVSMPANAWLQYDDFAVDNGTWSTTVSTWWGKSTRVWSAGDVFSAVGAGMSIAGTSLPVKTSSIPLNGLASLNVDAEVVKSAILAARASPALNLGAIIGVEKPLPLDALSSMLLSPSPVLHPFVLPASAAARMTLGQTQEAPATWLSQALARLIVSGYRATTGAWVAGASASALYGAEIDVQGMLGMTGEGQLNFAMSDLWTDTLRMTVLARMFPDGGRVATGPITLDGVGGLDLLGLAEQSRVLTMSPVAGLIVLGRKDTAGAVQLNGTPRLNVNGYKITRIISLPMSALAEMIIVGRLLHDVRMSDNVLAWILPGDVLAVLLD